MSISNKNISLNSLFKHKTCMFLCLLIMFMAFNLVHVGFAFAQVAAVNDAVSSDGVTPQLNDEKKEEVDKKTLFFNESVFFTKEEVSAIQRALLGVDTPDEDELINAPRILKLSGLLYKSSDNWVLWLNGSRVTPDRLLPEIIDIDVAPLKVHLKWFDYVINDVISITLRPHQVYHIETGVLLPG